MSLARQPTRTKLVEGEIINLLSQVIAEKLTDKGLAKAVHDIEAKIVVESKKEEKRSIENEMKALDYRFIYLKTHQLLLLHWVTQLEVPNISEKMQVINSCIYNVKEILKKLATNERAQAMATKIVWAEKQVTHIHEILKQQEGSKPQEKEIEKSQSGKRNLIKLSERMAIFSLRYVILESIYGYRHTKEDAEAFYQKSFSIKMYCEESRSEKQKPVVIGDTEKQKIDLGGELARWNGLEKNLPPILSADLSLDLLKQENMNSPLTQLLLERINKARSGYTEALRKLDLVKKIFERYVELSSHDNSRFNYLIIMGKAIVAAKKAKNEKLSIEQRKRLYILLQSLSKDKDPDLLFKQYYYELERFLTTCLTTKTGEQCIASLLAISNIILHSKDITTLKEEMATEMAKMEAEYFISDLFSPTLRRGEVDETINGLSIALTYVHCYGDKIIACDVKEWITKLQEIKTNISQGKDPVKDLASANQQLAEIVGAIKEYLKNNLTDPPNATQLIDLQEQIRDEINELNAINKTKHKPFDTNGDTTEMSGRSSSNTPSHRSRSIGSRRRNNRTLSRTEEHASWMDSFFAAEDNFVDDEKPPTTEQEQRGQSTAGVRFAPTSSPAPASTSINSRRLPDKQTRPASADREKVGLFSSIESTARTRSKSAAPPASVSRRGFKISGEPT